MKIIRCLFVFIVNFLIITFILDYRKSYLPLGYKYTEWTIRIGEIIQNNNKDNGGKLIFDNVVDYYTRNNFIFVLRMNVFEDPDYDMSLIYTSKKEYWGYNYITQEKFGPMNEVEFYDFRGKNNLKNSFGDIFFPLV